MGRRQAHGASVSPQRRRPEWRRRHQTASVEAMSIELMSMIKVHPKYNSNGGDDPPCNEMKNGNAACCPLPACGEEGAQCYGTAFGTDSWRFPSGMMAASKLAPSVKASVRIAFFRLAPSKLVPRRSAPCRLAPNRSTPAKIAPRKSAP